MRLIDADAAIEALTEYGNGRAVYIGVEEAVRRIEQLPSAQPEQRWIPVEERLPDPWSLVLVTDSCKNVSVCQLSWGNNNWYDECENWMYFPDSVIAWMPLPEPYKGEQE